MNIVIIYKQELDYQKYREKLFFLFKELDNKNKYYYFRIKQIEKDPEINNYENLEDLLKKRNESIKGNINHIFFYPRQIKYIDLSENLYRLIINTKIEKSIYIDDLHGLNIDSKLIDNFNYKFMPYSYVNSLFLKKNIIKLPHYLDNDFQYNNEEKNINISMLGHCTYDAYKIRKEINEKSENINLKLINCKISCYNKVTTEEYYKILKHSYVSIATTGDNKDFYYPYIVSKYFEIPGCNCLLLAHILPEMEEEMKSYGFIENENYIKFSNIDDLIEKCNYIFNPENYDKIEKIRENGFNLVKSKHLITNRVNTILNIINKKN